MVSLTRNIGDHASPDSQDGYDSNVGGWQDQVGSGSYAFEHVFETGIRGSSNSNGCLRFDNIGIDALHTIDSAELTVYITTAPGTSFNIDVYSDIGATSYDEDFSSTYRPNNTWTDGDTAAQFATGTTSGATISGIDVQAQVEDVLAVSGWVEKESIKLRLYPNTDPYFLAQFNDWEPDDNANAAELTITYTPAAGYPFVESSADFAEVETTSFVVTKPTGLAVDDLLFFVCSKDGGTVIDLPSGWSRATSSVANGTSNATDILYKIADSGDAAASNFTFTGDNQEYVGRLYRISGVDTTTPIDVEDATGNTGTSTAPVANGITTVTAKSMVFAVTGMDDDDTPYSQDTAGWVEDHNSVSSTSAGSTGIVIGRKLFTSASSATGNVAFTTNASDGWAAVQIGIRPAVAGGAATGKSNTFYGSFGGPLAGPIG